MKNFPDPLPFTDYQVKMVGYRQKDMKYQGFLFCSTTGASTDSFSCEFVCEEFSNTPAEALHAATALLQKLEASSN
jgi:hypothetical protein